MQECRIAAAAIVIRDNKVLLVRYGNKSNSSYLVGPGGGVRIDEDLQSALTREVKEETGLDVKPERILLIEDLLSRKYRMLKIWFLCTFVGGDLINTQEAEVEGIIEVNWFTREQLAGETVYPTILKEVNWSALCDPNRQTQYSGLKKADF